MKRKKVLLILVGGRPIPNILTVIHEQPEIIVPICSKESIKREWIELKPAIRKLLPTSTIIESRPVDAFRVSQIEKRCFRVIQRFPDAEWIFNVTTATSLMTLAAYKAAEKGHSVHNKSIRCWYLDTANTRVIALVGQTRRKSIFFIKVDQYLAAYNYQLGEGNLKDYKRRYLSPDWLAVAKALGQNPQKAALLKQILNNTEPKGAPKKSNADEPAIFKGYRIESSDEIYALLKELETVELVLKLREVNGKLHFNLSEQEYKFLNGAWLELYVYQVAEALGIFDDVQWQRRIVDNDPTRQARKPLEYNELDVSMTYKAQLMIIECKTGGEGKESRALEDITNIADSVGRDFVVKILATDQLIEDNSDFMTKAKRKGIYVVTGDKISQIRDTLEQQAKHPRYSRR